MIGGFIFLVGLGGCCIIEHFVKNTILRILFVGFLLALSFGAATKLGMLVGKTEQLNRFSRSLPRMFDALDKSKDNPELYARSINLIQSTVNTPSGLDSIEILERKVWKLVLEK